MKNNRRKNIIIYIVALFLITLTLLGLTYAYFLTRITGNSNSTSISVTTANLELVYQDGNGIVNVNNAKPGDTIVKTFSVKNEYENIANYELKLEKINNEFTRDDWFYELYSGTEINSANLLQEGKIKPNVSNEELIFFNQKTINSGSKTSPTIDEYTLVLTYDYAKENQIVDAGKTLSLKVNIGDIVKTTWAGAEEGTLLYALRENNEDTEPLTKIGEPSGMPGIPKQESIYELTNSEITYEGGSSSLNNENLKCIYGTSYTTTDNVFKINDIKNVTVSEMMQDLNNGVPIYIQWNYSPCLSKQSSIENRVSELNSREWETIYQVKEINETTSIYDSLYFSYRYGYNVTLFTENVLSKTSDDYGTSYYFRGEVKNNYLNFNGMCWRIVRVQGDGTIKIILADKNSECNSENYTGNGSIGTYYFDNLYKGVFDKWADEKQLDDSKLIYAEWCSSRNPLEPSLKCYGDNPTRTYHKIGLLTADEVVFSGISKTYYNIDKDSLKYISENGTSMTMTREYNNYIFYNRYLSTSGSKYNIRPSVVLKSDVLVDYNLSSTDIPGTINNPYIIR